MGRRSKNKQQAPPPMSAPRNSKQQPRKGKRKAEEDDVVVPSSSPSTTTPSVPMKKSKKQEKQEEEPVELPIEKGTKMTERQKKKALAEVERLELLLTSQGFNVDSDEEVEEQEEDGEENDDEIEFEQDDQDDDQEVELDEEEMQNDDDEEDDDEEEEEEEEGEPSDFILPTIEDREQEKVMGADLQVVQMRIQEMVAILGNFKTLATDGRSRSDYIEQLLSDICTYYGYNSFLAEKLFHLFSPAEAIEFFEANETPRPITIRANTLRTRRRDLAQALINRGVNLEPIGKWSKVGLQIFESSVPIGATPEYLAGHYMLQAASSFLPCIALAPQPHERVLDMASAPGGKSAYLSALMQNTGTIFANDSNKARIKSLNANLHRLGCKNVVVCNHDGRSFPKVIGGFDRVLLDSPCSGTGVIHKDASVKTNKSERDFQLLTHLQKQLLLCAIDSINPKSSTGGYVVYSTCSVMVEENEQVVEYVLKKRPNVHIVKTSILFGKDGFTKFRGHSFNDKMNLARRIFPHVHNLDGFFLVKLKVEPISPSYTAAQKVKAQADQEEQDETTTTKSKTKQVQEQQQEQDEIWDTEQDQSLMQKSLQRHEKKKSRK